MILTGEAIAAIVTALLAGLGGLALALSNARNNVKQSEMTGMQTVFDTLQKQVNAQAAQIQGLQNENSALHDRDNALGAENLQQRKELEAVREENRKLRAEVEVLRQENAALKAELDTYRRKHKGTGEA